MPLAGLAGAAGGRPAGTPGGSDEAALQSFLASLPADQAVAARTLAHAWTASGGTFQAGRLTVRLLAQGLNGQPFTAATLHGIGPSGVPRLELGRVLLYAHGLGPADWTSWCDERPELAQHGFDRAAKYPSVPPAGPPPAGVAPLPLGPRHLCRLAQGQPA